MNAGMALMCICILTGRTETQHLGGGGRYVHLGLLDLVPASAQHASVLDQVEFDHSQHSEMEIAMLLLQALRMKGATSRAIKFTGWTLSR